MIKYIKSSDDNKYWGNDYISSEYEYRGLQEDRYYKYCDMVDAAHNACQILDGWKYKLTGDFPAEATVELDNLVHRCYYELLRAVDTLQVNADKVNQILSNNGRM